MNQNINLDRTKKCATAKVHALSHDGRGIANVDYKTLFIRGALPNEIVAYQITQQRSHYHEAELLEIIHASSERHPPPCQHFGVCGGCSLQHMTTSMQMAFKQKTLLEQLKHF